MIETFDLIKAYDVAATEFSLGEPGIGTEKDNEQTVKEVLG